jgi:ATP diphosphatase
LQVIAAKVGFDWNEARLVVAKIREEIDEVEAALDDPGHLEEEVGDLLFAVVNLARHAQIDADTALRRANRKFERRFAFIEQSLAARNVSLQSASLADMEALWVAAKATET